MKNDKTVFTLWSGGLDSTYLIHKLLCDGYKVRAGYCEIMNNQDQIRAEKKAISIMKPFFEKYDFNYLGVIARAEILRVSEPVCLKQVPFFLFTAVQCCGDEDEIAMGYVMNDDAISYLPDIEAIYKSYAGICDRPLPKLTFPLVKISKQRIIREIPKHLLRNISFCEFGTNCGTCVSCERWKQLQEYGKYPKNLKREFLK